jgi:hypothetical protein
MRTKAEATSSNRYPRYDSGRTHSYHPKRARLFSPQSACSRLFRLTSLRLLSFLLNPSKGGTHQYVLKAREDQLMWIAHTLMMFVVLGLGLSMVSSPPPSDRR